MTGDYTERISCLKEALAKEFDIKDLETLDIRKKVLWLLNIGTSWIYKKKLEC